MSTQNITKQYNRTQQIKIKRKRNETKQNETKRNETKRKERKGKERKGEETKQKKTEQNFGFALKGQITEYTTGRNKTCCR